MGYLVPGLMTGLRTKKKKKKKKKRKEKKKKEKKLVLRGTGQMHESPRAGGLRVHDKHEAEEEKSRAATPEKFWPLRIQMKEVEGEPSSFYEDGLDCYL